MKITNLKTNKELEDYIRFNSFSLIGSGSEGRCFRTYDNKALKVFYKDYHRISMEYDVNSVITEDDIKLDSFAFPQELITVNNKLRGYKSNLVLGDLFSPSNTCDVSTITSINFKSLIKAYKKMYEDICVLSDNDILIYDMPFNVMFDGDKLTAVDTCCYTKSNKLVFDDNMWSFNSAIELQFSVWLNKYKRFDERIHGNNITSYLCKVYDALPEEIQERMVRPRVKRKTK